jgi:hypothetical protein
MIQIKDWKTVLFGSKNEFFCHEVKKQLIKKGQL